MSIVFLALAAICNATMDVSVHHYYNSIFSHLNPYWWNGEISWSSKYINKDSKQGRVKWFKNVNKPVQLTDAFHFFKMWMIVFICLSIVTFTPLTSPYIMFIVYGIVWNTCFSIFYNGVLVK